MRRKLLIALPVLILGIAVAALWWRIDGESLGAVVLEKGDFKELLVVVRDESGIPVAGATIEVKGIEVRSVSYGWNAEEDGLSTQRSTARRICDG